MIGFCLQEDGEKMGKTLIITEKPSVAREFASILKVKGNGNGLIEDDNYVITWCVGHLVAMSYPEKYDEKYKKWNIEDLPFLPAEYKYEVIKDVKAQYDIVHKQLHRGDIDTVLWAGDSGREGQVIEENIRLYGGVRKGMLEKRIWIDSQTEEEIKRGIREAKPMSAYDNLGKAGIMRAIEDYAMGINFSRALSCKFGYQFNQAIKSDKWKTISVGRVMTCVLGMVVEREREIRNFKPTPFYKITSLIENDSVEAEWRAIEGSRLFESPLLYSKNGFKAESDADAFIKTLPDTVVIDKVDKTVEKKYAPNLFNLAELQAECSKLFKISPDDTLKVAQTLYEKKLTTYPRTDARVLSSAVAKVIQSNITGLKQYADVTAFCDTILSNNWHKDIVKSKYTDDSKVTDHYAIIPTGEGFGNIASLSSIEKNVFNLIAKRFLAVFYPPAEYQKVSVEEKAGTETFFASVKTLQTPGYMEVSGIPQGDVGKGNLLAVLQNLKKGDSYNVKYRKDKGETTAPKRYTSGSMVLAMENAGNLIEDEDLRAQIKGSGIGTSATRAEIIKKLIKIEYLSLNTKTQVLTPHEDGEKIYDIVKEHLPQLLSPKMTASWEKGLAQIEAGELDNNKYQQILYDFVRNNVNKIIEAEGGGVVAETEPEVIGICPACGGNIQTTPFGYGCSNYNKDGSGCSFAIGSIASKKLSKEQIKKLLTDKITNEISGFKAKSGKTFNAKLKLTDECKIEFVFAERAEPVQSVVPCPSCGRNMKKGEWNYECECGVKISHTVASKKVSESDMIELIKNRKTHKISGFKSKSGKAFEASLVLTDDFKVQFSFN